MSVHPREWLPSTQHDQRLKLQIFQKDLPKPEGPWLLHLPQPERGRLAVAVRPSLLFTCLFCMKPEDARMGVLQGTPEGSSPFFLMLPSQQLTVGDASLFKQLQAPTGEGFREGWLGGTGLQPQSKGWHLIRGQKHQRKACLQKQPGQTCPLLKRRTALCDVWQRESLQAIWSKQESWNHSNIFTEPCSSSKEAATIPATGVMSRSEGDQSALEMGPRPGALQNGFHGHRATKATCL